MKKSISKNIAELFLLLAPILAGFLGFYAFFEKHRCVASILLITLTVAEAFWVLLAKRTGQYKGSGFRFHFAIRVAAGISIPLVLTVGSWLIFTNHTCSCKDCLKQKLEIPKANPLLTTIMITNFEAEPPHDVSEYILFKLDNQYQQRDSIEVLYLDTMITASKGGNNAAKFIAEEAQIKQGLVLWGTFLTSLDKRLLCSFHMRGMGEVNDTLLVLKSPEILNDLDFGVGKIICFANFVIGQSYYLKRDYKKALHFFEHGGITCDIDAFTLNCNVFYAACCRYYLGDLQRSEEGFLSIPVEYHSQLPVPENLEIIRNTLITSNAHDLASGLPLPPNPLSNTKISHGPLQDSKMNALSSPSTDQVTPSPMDKISTQDDAWNNRELDSSRSKSASTTELSEENTSFKKIEGNYTHVEIIESTHEKGKIFYEDGDFMISSYKYLWEEYGCPVEFLISTKEAYTVTIGISLEVGLQYTYNRTYDYRFYQIPANSEKYRLCITKLPGRPEVVKIGYRKKGTYANKYVYANNKGKILK
jgi:hypothetical protein